MSNKREVKKLNKIVKKIEALDEEMMAKTDEELRAKTDEFKERLRNGETMDDILIEAFAVCREAATRTVGMKHFPVQLLGGIVLHQGRIAEMETGGGKTLVATLPAYLNALTGHSVHIVTVNNYLVKRDADWMGKVYSFLGLTVGYIFDDMDIDEKKEIYQRDIVYGTNSAFGFDYLRDNMAIYKDDQMQTELNFAIIDEVDSILIDEARTPLIISGSGEYTADLYFKADEFVRTLDKEIDTNPDEKDRKIALSDEGVKKAEQFFELENYGDPDNIELGHYVKQALHAHFMMDRDVDYVVKDGEVFIVDEFTGRIMPGRRYNEGLHQAIEAKEHVEVRPETQTCATITIQNLFRMYRKIAGMTGTAKTEESEFRTIYNMDVVSIPPNKPIIRVDLQDAVYPTEKGKFKAIADRAEEIHKTGQPLLIGTVSIEKSELISDMLKKRGIKHEVLNAKQHAREAEIIAQAGRVNRVTIATNMAGRGTDILLGGNPEYEACREMRKIGYSDDEISFATGYAKTSDENLMKARNEFLELKEKFRPECDKEHDQVAALGGLYIIGTERHESRRIDNQLRGRAGRQGDPGKTEFCISLEDDLMQRFGGEKMKNWLNVACDSEDEPLISGALTRSIENAQKKVEGRNFGARKYVLQYDDIMNKQREIIYKERQKVLDGENLKQDILDMTCEEVKSIVRPYIFDTKYPEEWDMKGIEKEIKRITPEYRARIKPDKKTTAETLVHDIMEELTRVYDKKDEEIGSDHMREAEHMIMLQTVDRYWMAHINEMDQLRTGIQLRAIGQKDPVAAYAEEGFDLFDAMTRNIRRETVMYCYSATLDTNTERKAVINVYGENERDQMIEEMQKDGMEKLAADLAKLNRINEDVEKINSHLKDPSAPVSYRRKTPKIGRNEKCPCGSGKKYKNCCLRKDQTKRGA